MNGNKHKASLRLYRLNFIFVVVCWFPFWKKIFFYTLWNCLKQRRWSKRITRFQVKDFKLFFVEVVVVVAQVTCLIQITWEPRPQSCDNICLHVADFLLLPFSVCIQRSNRRHNCNFLCVLKYCCKIIIIHCNWQCQCAGLYIIETLCLHFLIWIEFCKALQFNQSQIEVVWSWYLYRYEKAYWNCKGTPISIIVAILQYFTKLPI